MDELVRIEQKIFIYLINTASFLKTIKNKGLSNEQTDELSAKIAQLNDLYDKSAQLAQGMDKIELWRPAVQVLDKIHDLLINMHYQDRDLINEKADLQVEATSLKENLTQYIQRLDKQQKN